MDLFKVFSNKPTPKDVAKDRLKLILIHDRGDLAPEVLENIKQEILQVISKYVEIDSDDIDITITKTGEMDGDSPALVANIPIKNVRGR
ncbi:cell division topological specificity factor MinE [Clostridium sp. YIM B02505]|uniref:Cell division topological specificity factor n=1 Tax=Clostridium yunnanense TaxID=2800325 RepID=A0ABS1EPU4_9CLOT|nr:cell division topological specificity factor MinE [Clostridium yunnanense]MBK1811349.1 cell division topological specificity factor MinE [Clostridium yunnanense]